MKSFYGVAAVLALAGMAACAQTDDADQDAGTDTAAAAPATTPAQTTGAVSDAQILHIAKTANDADIEGGNLAKTPELRNVLTPVRATVEANLTRARDIQRKLR